MSEMERKTSAVDVLIEEVRKAQDEKRLTISLHRMQAVEIVEESLALGTAFDLIRKERDRQEPVMDEVVRIAEGHARRATRSDIACNCHLCVVFDEWMDAKKRDETPEEQRVMELRAEIKKARHNRNRQKKREEAGLPVKVSSVVWDGDLRLLKSQLEILKPSLGRRS